MDSSWVPRPQKAAQRGIRISDSDRDRNSELRRSQSPDGERLRRLGSVASAASLVKYLATQGNHHSLSVHRGFNRAVPARALPTHAERPAAGEALRDEPAGVRA